MKIVKVDEELKRIFEHSRALSESAKIVIESIISVQAEEIKKVNLIWDEVRKKAQEQYPDDNVSNLTFDHGSKVFYFK
jgi:DNA helicase IV